MLSLDKNQIVDAGKIDIANALANSQIRVLTLGNGTQLDVAQKSINASREKLGDAGVALLAAFLRNPQTQWTNLKYVLLQFMDDVT